MDWIEEKVEIIKRYIQNSSLKVSLFFYLVIAGIGAGTSYLLIRYVCVMWRNAVTRKYSDMVVVEDLLRWINVENVTGKDELILKTAWFMIQYGLFFFIVGAVFLAIHLFFEHKIIPPFAESKTAIGYLALGDYGHETAYNSDDELGKLCVEVEHLRLKLIEQKRRQWDGQKEQRNINGAFAHDMRTPLTVMQGYTEFLLKFVPQGKVSTEMLLEKLAAMKHQQERLLQFSMTMTQIQNMEMREVNCSWYEIDEIKRRIGTEADGFAPLCQKTVVCTKQMEQKEGKLLVDLNLILEVFENLLNNAGRYAKERIEIQTELRNRMFTIYMKDDGPGFSPRALREASGVYYSEEKSGGEHFGMGLFISRSLCERHGGTLTLVNSVEGGAICAASFLINVQK